MTRQQLSIVATIVRWVVVAGGVIVIAVSLYSIRQLAHPIIVIFPLLMVSGITLNYVRATPVVFPGAIFYLIAYGYLLYTAWRIDRRARNNRKDPP